MTKELGKIQGNKKNANEVFPEHEFLGSCLRIGLHIADLKELTYVDVMKILLTFIENNSVDYSRKATQKDIDKLLG